MKKRSKLLLIAMLVLSSLVRSDTAAYGQSVNAPKIAPYFESPFVNLWNSRGAVREDGNHYIDITVQPLNYNEISQLHSFWTGQPNAIQIEGPLLEAWRFDDGNRHIDYLYRGDQRLKVSVTGDPRNVWIAYDSDVSDNTVTDAYAAAVEPFDTIRYLDWMGVNNATGSMSWSTRPGHDDDWSLGTPGVPPEVIIESANLTKTTPWLTIPHTATSDYVQIFANLVDEVLDPSLDVIVEWSNETWNPIFDQQMSAAQYGRQSARLFEVFENTVGADRVHTVIAGQAVNASYARFAQNIAGGDIIATAAYVRVEPADMGEIYRQFSNGRRPDGQIFDLLYGSLRQRVVGWREHAEIAAETGSELRAYEGGQALQPFGAEQQNDSEFVGWLNSLQNDPRMGQLYHDIAASWEAIGGDSDRIAWYQLADAETSNGSWGLRDSLLGNSFKWEAVLDIAGEPNIVIEMDDSILINERLYFAGDSNYDRQFNSQDLTQVFRSGIYGTERNASWDQGDWNHDGRFNSSDLVAAFRSGTYTLGAGANVPEPETSTWLGLLFFAVLSCRYSFLPAPPTT